MSVSKLAAQYYWIDARDFADRFDLLWEASFTKQEESKLLLIYLWGVNAC